MSNNLPQVSVNALADLLSAIESQIYTLGTSSTNDDLNPVMADLMICEGYVRAMGFLDMPDPNVLDHVADLLVFDRFIFKVTGQDTTTINKALGLVESLIGECRPALVVAFTAEEVEEIRRLREYDCCEGCACEGGES